jgi:hypothetical protein
MGHINLLMDENECKIDPINRMKILIVVSPKRERDQTTTRPLVEDLTLTERE